MIFVDSMADPFAANVPEDQVRRFLTAMAAMVNAPHKTFQSLTKAAPQLLKYADVLPPNLWVGVSSPPDWMMGKRLSRRQQETMLRRSLDVLHEVKRRTGNIVWMSAEPVSWDLTAVIDTNHSLDWIVIGAASDASDASACLPAPAVRMTKLLGLYHLMSPFLSLYFKRPRFRVPRRRATTE